MKIKNQIRFQNQWNNLSRRLWLIIKKVFLNKNKRKYQIIRA